MIFNKYAYVVVFFFSISVIAQDTATNEIIEELNTKIEASSQGEKLKWLDSLSRYITNSTNYESDSIVKTTVDFAIALDSLNIATWNTANLIFYQNNRKGNASKGNEIFENFLPVAKKATNHKALAKYYIEGADSYYFLKQYPEAIDYYKIAESEARQANYKRFEGIAKLYRGGTLSFMGEFSEASQVLQEASKIFRATKDTFNIISSQNTLSILYSQNDFFDEAEKEREEAIRLAKKINSYGHLLSFYYNAATDANKQGHYQREIAYLKKSIAANEKVESPEVHIPAIYTSLIKAYSQVDSIPQAERLLAILESEPSKYTEGYRRATYLKALKHVAFAKKNYRDAIRYGKEYLTLSKEGLHYEELQGAEEFLAKAYEAVGDDQSAFKHFKTFYRIKDSVTNLKKVKALTYYQTLYETEKRDFKIKSQEKDIALLDVKSKIKSQWMLFGGLGLLAAFGLVLIIKSKNAAKKRQNMQEEFSQDLINAQEQERIRVARELHDSVGQKLMLLTKKTKEKNDPAMETLASGTLGELRSIAKGLHPATMEKLGLSASIRSMINEVDDNTTIFFTHEIEDVDQLLSKEASLHVYRIVQEVLNNMVKHSDAKAASIVLSEEGEVIKATIKDNGKGFNFSEKIVEASGLGMKTLLERAKIIKSKLHIDSKELGGTTISLLIPKYV